MDKEEVVLELSSGPFEGIRAFFDDCKTPLNLSEFVDSYLGAFWDFLLRQGYIEKVNRIREEAGTGRGTRCGRECRLVFLEAMEDWNGNVRCGLPESFRR